MINEMLEKLFDLRCQRDALALEKQALVDTVLTPEIKNALASIDAEYAARTDAVCANITEAEAAVKAEVLASGKTVKTAHLQAVFMKGRVSWDVKGVEGFALAYPELMAYRKEGEPSVSIRTV